MVKMNKKDLALFCYPWDVIDEGYDAIIDAVKRSGLNAIYITVNYGKNCIKLNLWHKAA